MNEDLGMLAGAYGLLPDDERLFDIKQILAAEGIDYRFGYVDFPAGSHPNSVKYVLTDSKGRMVTLTGSSTGGGMIETVQIMGVPYRFIGDSFLACAKAEERAVKAFCGKTSGILSAEPISGPNGENLYFFRSEKRLDGLADEVDSVIFQLDPILPVPTLAQKIVNYSG